MVLAAQMSGVPDITDEAVRLDALFRAKARAEIGAADALADASHAVRSQGDELADVLLVKGEPGPADLAAGKALAGEDGIAAGKALDAIGVSGSRFALCTRPPGIADGVRPQRLTLILEAVDPRVIIALDPVAARDIADACGMDPLAPGVLTSWRGRSVLALDGLEASLADDRLKRRVWTQIKALAALIHLAT